MQSVAGVLTLTSVLLNVVVACGGRTEGAGGGAGRGGGTGRGGTAGNSGSPAASGEAPNGGSSGAADAGAGGSAAANGAEGGNGAAGRGRDCEPATTVVSLVREPVDVIVVVDNSGSMSEECSAVEASLNANFASVLEGFGVDYRVILMSRHRSGHRTTGETAANLSVCITAPLSGNGTCPVPLPVFSERFYHYSQKVESFDALNWILDAYAAPPEDDESATLAPDGYSPWLRAEARKAFVLFSDDDEGNTGDLNPITIQQFLEGLGALSVEHFGTPQAPAFSFHSVVGLKEKADPSEAYLPGDPVQNEVCTGNRVQVPRRASRTSSSVE